MAPFGDEVWLHKVRDGKRNIWFCFLHSANMALFVSALLQIVMISTCRRVYVFHSTENVETLRSIGWCCAVINSTWNNFPKSPSSFIPMKAITCANNQHDMLSSLPKEQRSCLGVSWFCTRKLIQLHCQKKTSSNLGLALSNLSLHPRSLRYIFPACVTSFNQPFLVKRPFEPKDTGLFWTLSSKHGCHSGQAQPQ